MSVLCVPLANGSSKHPRPDPTHSQWKNIRQYPKHAPKPGRKRCFPLEGKTAPVAVAEHINRHRKPEERATWTKLRKTSSPNNRLQNSILQGVGGNECGRKCIIILHAHVFPRTPHTRHTVVINPSSWSSQSSRPSGGRLTDVIMCMCACASVQFILLSYFLSKTTTSSEEYDKSDREE